MSAYFDKNNRRRSILKHCGQTDRRTDSRTEPQMRYDTIEEFNVNNVD